MIISKKSDSQIEGAKNQIEPIGARAEFYLVYLAFYFFPWLFQTPSGKDVLAAVVAIAIFIPIYFHGAKQRGLNSWPHIIAMSLIGFLVSPFFGAHGVFHIYASVQAGFLRPERSAWIAIILLVVVFGLFSLLTGQAWWDFAFPIFVGIVTAVGTISTASKIEQHQSLERSRELDQHLAKLKERERIAQDLHDLLGQTLTMVSLKSEVALKLFDTRPDQAKQEIEEIRGAARTALKDVREAVAGMNTTTLKAELQGANRVLSSANIHLSIEGTMPDLNPQTDHVIALAVREAMTNIVRHSQASEAVFSVATKDDALLIVIKDDGQVAKLDTEGSGLTGLRKRIEDLGGSIDIISNPSVKISMQLPNWSTAP